MFATQRVFTQKTAVDIVSVDAAVASVLSELESISLLKKEDLRILLMEKMFPLFFQLALLVTGFFRP